MKHIPYVIGFIIALIVYAVVDITIKSHLAAEQTKLVTDAKAAIEEAEKQKSLEASLAKYCADKNMIHVRISGADWCLSNAEKINEQSTEE